jgi:hypothetical protein
MELKLLIFVEDCLILVVINYSVLMHYLFDALGRCLY